MIVCLIVMAALVGGCVAGPNALAGEPNESGEVAGFWLGLWHGIVSPITFVASLFADSVHFYEVHNSGGWYNFGFVVGAGILFSGGFMGRRRR